MKRHARTNNLAPRGRATTAPGVMRVGPWRVDIVAREMTDGVMEKRLSPRAASLLSLLVIAEGEVVSRDALMDGVWPDVTVGDESLTQAIAELRRAFGAWRGSPKAIETISKVGYRLVAPVVREMASDELSNGPGCEIFDLTAYNLCLEARQVLARSGRGSIELAEDLSREAAERARDFALAQADFAVMLVQRHLYRTDRRDRLREAAERAERAVRLRPDAAAGYTAKALVFGALERWGEAEWEIGRALSCDPTDAAAHYFGARTLFAAANYRGAAALGERAGQLDLDDYRALFLAARAARVFDPGRGRRNAEAALQRVQARLTYDPNEPRALNALGPLLAQLGQHDQAVAAFEADESRGAPIEFYNSVARAYVGDCDGAIEALETVTDRGWNHPAWLRAEPSLANLARERRFQRIGRALGAA